MYPGAVGQIVKADAIGMARGRADQDLPAKRPGRQQQLGVIDGIRTRDPRDHNPVLYQLSYDHHARGTRSPAPDNHSHIRWVPVARVPGAYG